jgi:hypothetical protein
MHYLFIVVLALASALAYGDQSDPRVAKKNWYRGNTHAHTINADGNVSPDSVVRWYREHGYQFVFITDHEYLADVTPLNAVHGAAEKFLVIGGQEVTQVLIDDTHPDGMRHAHVNGLGVNRRVMPVGSDRGSIFATGVTMAETYQRNFAGIRAAGGIPQVNHPNFRWSVKPEDLSELTGPFLLEIANGFPSANNLGGMDEKGNVILSTEALWDVLLGAGKVAWGVGSDDSHDYLHLDDPNSERPGKAWVVVRAAELTRENILEAMLKGEFYASNGVTLEDYAVNRSAMTITIKRPRDPRATDDRMFTTRFIGKEGRVLGESGGLKPSYTFRGDEEYVRAVIVDSNGMRAWTQPVMLSTRRP